MDPREIISTLRTRESVRLFDRRPIPPEVLRDILESARLAPSAKNMQPYRFIVMFRDEWGEEFDEFMYRPGFKDAPVAVVVLAKDADSYHRPVDRHPYAWVDASIAVTEMISAATAYGVGACWIVYLDAPKLKKVLEIPEDWDVVGIIPMGYPAHGPMSGTKRKRRPFEEMFMNGRFGIPLTEEEFLEKARRMEKAAPTDASASDSGEE